jgi:hypothetical protein
MMPKLGDYFEVALGYKTLMNDFFYLDQDTINIWKIEEKFLRPILRLADLDSTAYRQPASGKIKLFYCTVEQGDLRGTGAGKYIDWAERQETGAKKQSGARMTWREALEKQGGAYWWRPKAALKPTKIALRKAIDVLHAPFIFSAPVNVDQRLYAVKPKESVDEGLSTAYLCSSLFALALEVNADLGLGAGVLTLGVRSLIDLPCPDLGKSLEPKALAALAKALEALLETAPPSALEVRTGSAMRQLDIELMAILGFSDLKVNDVRSEVARLTASRKLLASERSSLALASANLDVQAVADSIFEKLKPWLSGRRFPEDFQSKEDLVHVTMPNVPLSADTMVMLGQCELKILQADQSRKVLFSASYDSAVAELILRSLQMGRRDFHVVATHERALAALDQLEDYLDELQLRLDSAISETGIGPRWEGEIRRRVLDQAKLDLRELRRPFDSQWHWPIRIF